MAAAAFSTVRARHHVTAEHVAVPEQAARRIGKPPGVMPGKPTPRAGLERDSLPLAPAHPERHSLLARRNTDEPSVEPLEFVHP